MKRLLSFLISMAIVLGTLPAVIVSAEVTSLNGSGTETSPYEISTAEELAFAVDMINNTDANTAHFKLLADIDYGEQEWEPIGSTSRPFKGVFDGNGKKITSLNVTCLDTEKTTFIYPKIGIFGKIERAKVKNLGVDDFTVAVKNHDYYPNGANDSTKFRTSNIGGFVSEADNSVFENCYISNSSVRNLRRDCFDGGVAGFAAKASGLTSFKNCYVYNVDLCSGYGAPQAGFISNIVSAVVKFENCYTADVEIVTEGASHLDHVSATYGFGYRSCTSDPTVINSYTTLEDNEDVDADYPDNKTPTHAYTAAQSLLAETSDKNEIVSALVDATDEYCAWTVDESVNNGYPYHTFTEIPNPDRDAVEADLAAITIESRVSSSFSVPTSGENGTSIEWASDDESAIVISDGTAIVICDPDSEKTVKLTVAVSKGEFSLSKEITVVVEKLKYIKAGEKQSVTNPDGTVTVTIDVNYSGISGKYRTLTYMAVITDSTGKILQRVKKDVGVGTAEAGTASFEVTHRAVAENETVNYYLWGDGNISLLDNKPSAIKDFEAKSKVTSITLSWAQSYDDSGAPVKYKIYRNGTLYDTVMTNTYIAAGSDTESYSYKVVPVDTANKAGESKETAPMKLRQMFYNKPDSSWGINKTSGGVGDSYYEVIDVLIDGVETKVYVTDTTERDRMIYFARADAIKGNDAVPRTERNLTFVVYYLDNSTKPLQFIYNSEIPEGAQDSWQIARKEIAIPRVNDGFWKEKVIHVTDAELRNSEKTGEAEFGVMASKGTPKDETQVKEIRFCKTSDYE